MCDAIDLFKNFPNKGIKGSHRWSQVTSTSIRIFALRSIVIEYSNIVFQFVSIPLHSYFLPSRKFTSTTKTKHSTTISIKWKIQNNMNRIQHGYIVLAHIDLWIHENYCFWNIVLLENMKWKQLRCVVHSFSNLYDEISPN